jgi:hypothetical protein
MKDLEHQIQWSICQYLDYKKVFYFAVPNGSLRNIGVAKKLKQEGVKAGVSDLIILLPNRVLFIEVKTDKGKQQNTQKEFQNKVQELGFEYYIVRSVNDIELLLKEKND